MAWTSKRNLATKRRKPTLERKVYRSRLEERIAKQLDTEGVAFEYELGRYEYEVPAKMHRYTPDFFLPKGVTLEAKGYLDLDDRKKLELMKTQHPDLDLRLVFQNADKPIRKGSPTSYAMWAEKVGYLYSDKGVVPDEWLMEVT